MNVSRPARRCISSRFLASGRTLSMSFGQDVGVERHEVGLLGCRRPRSRIRSRTLSTLWSLAPDMRNASAPAPSFTSCRDVRRRRRRAAHGEGERRRAADQRPIEVEEGGAATRRRAVLGHRPSAPWGLTTGSPQWSGEDGGATGSGPVRWVSRRRARGRRPRPRRASGARTGRAVRGRGRRRPRPWPRRPGRGRRHRAVRYCAVTGDRCAPGWRRRTGRPARWRPTYRRSTTGSVRPPVALS